MIFIPAPLKGAYIVEPEKSEDERGYFARAFCKEEFERRGLCAEFVQHNLSYNAHKGTIRGLHYQKPPYGEIKLVRCVKGGVFDVIVDLREDSETYLRWFGAELNESGKALYIPKGFAHGFQTLAEGTALYYLMSELYREGSEAGIRWDDKTLGIRWPMRAPIIVSERDRALKTIGGRSMQKEKAFAQIQHCDTDEEPRANAVPYP